MWDIALKPFSGTAKIVGSNPIRSTSSFSISDFRFSIAASRPCEFYLSRKHAPAVEGELQSCSLDRDSIFKNTTSQCATLIHPRPLPKRHPSPPRSVKHVLTQMCKGSGDTYKEPVAIQGIDRRNASARASPRRVAEGLNHNLSCWRQSLTSRTGEGSMCGGGIGSRCRTTRRRE
jgi:hypothetical protein